MAEDVQYAPGADTATNKRKFDDSPPPAQLSSSGTRKPTGFSAPIMSSTPDSGHAPSLYNNVPPPMDEIQLAKQRAQEIAARLFNSADPKRLRVENGSGFDSVSPPGGLAPSAVPVSYGFQNTSKSVDIPNARVGVIIGKGGETIKYLQQQSGARIQVTRDMDSDPNSPTRPVELMGTSEQIMKAEHLIKDVLNEADAGGSNIISKRLTGQTEQFIMNIPNNKVGLIIGKGGETIKNMQATSGARIQVIPLHLPSGDPSTGRTLQIDGTSEQLESAKQLVNEVISENRLRNSGGYMQQGYQARPQANWGNPPQPLIQQPGYGYMQPQYNTSQPMYAGYPQQQPGGYSSSMWDQTARPQSQPTALGSGYDYYSQQTPSSAPQADSTGHNYNNQPPASSYLGQGYTQDGYNGGYNAAAPRGGGYNGGYDQQQGFCSAPPAYANMPSLNQDGQHASSTYGILAENPQATPPSQSGYNAGHQVDYGQPQAPKLPVSQSPYGQDQQVPGVQQGVYVQPAPVQSGFLPQRQSAPAGYGQPDAATRATGSTGFSAPASQAGYGPSSHGSQPVVQQPYGLQQPSYIGGAYGGAYGSGYSQPPVYSADATQAVQQSGKASPQS